MNIRLTHTGLFTEYARIMLERCCDEIKYLAHSTRMKNKFWSVKIVIEPNGEVCCSTENDYYSRRSFTNAKTELDARIWLARTIKWAASARFLEWKRDNEIFLLHSRYLTEYTVQDIYALYDVLIDRKNLESKYPKEVLDKIRGCERDALATELEITKRQELEACKAKWSETLKELDPDSYYSKAYQEIGEKVRQFRDKLTAEYRVPYKKACAERDAELKAIEEMANFATTESVASFPFAD